MSNAPKLDDATPFPWSQIRKPAKAKAVRKTSEVQTDAGVRFPERASGNIPLAGQGSEEPGSLFARDMQAVAVALFGECRECGCLLDIDGTCPDASKHEKHVCPDCGAESAERLSVARPCLFESEHGKRAAE